VVHELEPKLIITIMHGQQHIKTVILCIILCTVFLRFVDDGMEKERF